MKTYKLEKFDPEKQSVLTVEMTLDQIIANPYGLHYSDVLPLLLNELREQKGLTTISHDLFAESNYRLY